MYETVTEHFFRLQIAKDVYIIAAQRMWSARNRRTNKRERKLRLFPRAGAPNFVAIDILGPFPKTKSGNKYIVVITDCCYKLTIPFLTKKTTATRLSNIFKEHWVPNF